MNYVALFKGFLLFMLAHSCTIFQLNGQFKWNWFKENEWVVILFGLPISLFFILATKYTVKGFDGLLWPTKFIGFGIGIILYYIFIVRFFNEELSLKTIISLILSIVLICLQVFWKD